jgi:hypothetical protein
MKLNSIDRRLEDLERKHTEPIEVRPYWSEDEIPPESRGSVIRLKWLAG